MSHKQVKPKNASAFCWKVAYTTNKFLEACSLEGQILQEKYLRLQTATHGRRNGG